MLVRLVRWIPLQTARAILHALIVLLDRALLLVQGDAHSALPASMLALASASFAPLASTAVLVLLPA